MNISSIYITTKSGNKVSMPVNQYTEYKNLSDQFSLISHLIGVNWNAVRYAFTIVIACTIVSIDRTQKFGIIYIDFHNTAINFLTIYDRLDYFAKKFNCVISTTLLILDNTELYNMTLDKTSNLFILSYSTPTYMYEFESYLQKILLSVPYYLVAPQNIIQIKSPVTNYVDNSNSKYVKLRIYDTSTCDCYKGEKIYNITIKKQYINNINKIKKKIQEYKSNSVQIDYDIDNQSLTVRGQNEYNLHLKK
jgi:hypothetical protein